MTERLGIERATPPEITVIVLTYNHERYVRQTIQAILDQGIEAEIEVVVHDDASNDSTQEILRGLRADHPDRLSLILQSENQLRSGANFFASLLLDVESPYIAFCEGDDLWTDTTKLQRQHEFMQENTWCSLSHHGVAVLNDGGNTEYQQSLMTLLSQPDRVRTRVAGVELATSNFLMTCSVMLRRDALRDDFLEGCTTPWDLLLFALAAEAGDIGYLPEVMAMYRLHPSNAWSGRSSEERLALEMEARWFLASRLNGRMQLAFQDALVERLFAGGPDGQLPAVARRVREFSQLQGAYQELDRAHQERNRAYGQFEEAYRELESSRAAVSLRLDAALEQLRATQAELAATAEVGATLQATLDEVWRSRSWKVTKPLRQGWPRLGVPVRLTQQARRRK